VRPVAQHLVDVAPVAVRHEDAARTTVDVPELLAGEADGGRVDDRRHLVGVVGDHAVEQRLVAVLQRLQQDVLGERRLQPMEVLEHPGDLLLLRRHVRRQQAAQAQRVALLLGERGALVERRLAQQRDAAREPRGNLLVGMPRTPRVHGA
jgi:hypothetical protein